MRVTGFHGVWIALAIGCASRDVREQTVGAAPTAPARTARASLDRLALGELASLVARSRIGAPAATIAFQGARASSALSVRVGARARDAVHVEAARELWIEVSARAASTCT
ncbi:MAG: hypothetical protein ACHREM_19685, partial [Polyangiales bacterium]